MKDIWNTFVRIWSVSCIMSYWLQKRKALKYNNTNTKPNTVLTICWKYNSHISWFKDDHLFAYRASTHLKPAVERHLWAVDSVWLVGSDNNGSVNKPIKWSSGRASITVPLEVGYILFVYLVLFMFTVRCAVFTMLSVNIQFSVWKLRVCAWSFQFHGTTVLAFFVGLWQSAQVGSENVWTIECTVYVYNQRNEEVRFLQSLQCIAFVAFDFSSIVRIVLVTKNLLIINKLLLDLLNFLVEQAIWERKVLFVF